MYNIDEFTIPYGVTKIRDSVFHTSSLKGVVIPDSVTEIGDRAFDWNGLENITVDKDNPAYKSVNGNLYTNNINHFDKLLTFLQHGAY